MLLKKGNIGGGPIEQLQRANVMFGHNPVQFGTPGFLDEEPR